VKAWRVNRFGPSFSGLELMELPIPSIDADTVLVRVSAAGVNFPDALVVEGTYQVRPDLPFTPGFEAVGEVVSIGDNCKSLRVGQRVICWCGFGAFSEFIAIRPEHTFPVPGDMSDAEAAAFLVSYQTAFFALFPRGRLQRGEVLLVHAGAGALGSAAIQLGKAVGATVIATSSNAEKAALCTKLGADSVFDNTVEFAKLIRDATGGRGANVVVDPVGGEVFEQSLKCIAWEGRLLPVGFTSGVIPSIPANRILLKNISVVGIFWSEYWKHAPSQIRDAHDQLTTFYEQGLLKPLIGKVLRFDELPAALLAAKSRSNFGKVIISAGVS
jgi:NADPH2:quinone reductase